MLVCVGRLRWILGGVDRFVAGGGDAFSLVAGVVFGGFGSLGDASRPVQGLY